MDIPPAIVRNAIIYMIEAVYKIKSRYLLSIRRGNTAICRSRQIAMYLMHVTCGYPTHIVGETFFRDRTTVSHACLTIEIAREKQKFDYTLYLMEITLLKMLNCGESCNS